MNLEELLAKVRQDFLGHLPVREAALRAALESGDLMGAKQLAHQLRGTAGSFGEHELGRRAGHLEDAIDEALGGADIDLQSFFDRLVDEVAAARS